MQITDINLIGTNYVIQKGTFWNPIVFLVKGDYTAWEPYGQIRNKAGGDLYADFQFEPIILVTKTIGEGEESEEITCSRIKPFLTVSQTSTIPVTPTVKEGKPLIAGRNRWEYDIVLQHPTDSEIVLPVVQGLIEINDTVTVIND